jgi:hypothetical protein
MSDNRANRPKSKMKFVGENINWGLYVWQMEDGKVLGDQDGNVLNVPSARGDLTKMARLSAAVRNLGIQGGEPLFLEGQRRVSDEEFDDQMARLIDGYTPDPYDIGALRDEAKGIKEHGRG